MTCTPQPTDTDTMIKTSVHKKNLSGGKNFKKQGSKGRRGERQNAEISAAFVDDVLEGNVPEDIVVARVTKMFGGGRAQLQMGDGKTQVAAIRGNLVVSAGAARAPGNALAISASSYVLLQLTDYGAQIAAILSRQQIQKIHDKIGASKGFFSNGDATEEIDGFEWDLSDEVVQETEVSDRAPLSDENVDVDAI